MLGGGFDRYDLGIVRAVTGRVENGLAVRAVDYIGLTADSNLIDVEVDVVTRMNLIAGVETGRGVAVDIGRDYWRGL